jgi:isoaspartyl peptidase/L-asparaginase-like protein (Ntn-hydrolase superfamily)
MAPYLIAVHAGAGYHTASKEAAYKSALRTALKAGADVLNKGGCSMAAVKAAICVLEVGAV